MRRTLLLFILSIFVTVKSDAQFTRYIVQFKDKGTSPYTLSNPLQYLSQRAIDRRTRYNIAVDSLDIPVTPRYIDSVRLSGNVTILNVSKWLNQVSIQTTDAQALAKINSLPFVLSAQPIAARVSTTPVNKTMETTLADIPVNGSTNRITADYFDYGKSNGQVKIHQGEFLHNHGFRGEGMQLAVMDAGFFNYDILPTFDSVRNSGRLLGTWDFVASETSVAEDNSHGMHCLSTIAANIPGVFVGTAPYSSFYLFRTEDVGSEYPIEEHNFSVGAERADSLGVDLCSTSLGYYSFDNAQFNHSYNDMNGNTTMSARATDIAASKGMLMVASAGNEGNNSWHYLITPSDADSAFAIGAVDTLGNVAGFSSYGPSSDGQIKPSVAAVGWNAVVANGFSGLPNYSSGTSFACPNMAGITTCLWQAFPEANNIEIMRTLEASANNFNTPDDRVGYGIPDAKKAFVMLQKKYFTQQANFDQCKANIQFSVKTDNTMSIDIERKFAGETVYTTITTLQNPAAYGMHNFEYADDLAGTNHPSVQYRLKMTIGTDTSYFLDSATVNYQNPCTVQPVNENSILITPNPVSDQLSVNVTRIAASKIEIILQNAAGQRVYSSSYQQQAGNLVKKINMNGYSRGIYFVTVFANNEKLVTKKILKQ